MSRNRVVDFSVKCRELGWIVFYRLFLFVVYGKYPV